jgi:hypothetical protein
MDPKQASIAKYFTSKSPTWTVLPIAVGLALLLGPMWAKVLGLLVLVGAGYAIYDSTRMIADHEIDQWTDVNLKRLSRRALEKIGIDGSEIVGESVIVTGPRLSNLGPARFGYRKGKDNVLRFTPVNTMIINFTQNQLLVYTCALDLIEGHAVNEVTDEYFYRDVVSVHTASETVRVSVAGNRKEWQLNDVETFKLTTSGGTSVVMPLRHPSLIQRMGGGEIPTTTAERAIQAIRKMLREKKSAISAT